MSQQLEDPAASAILQDGTALPLLLIDRYGGLALVIWRETGDRQVIGGR